MTTAITLLPTDCDAETLVQYAAVLATDERERAARFRQSADARRYVVTRAALRMLLAQHVRQTPQTLMLRTIGRGKPVLDAAPDVHFNVSHAGDWSVIAIGATPVGIDIECCRVLDYRAVGATVFSAAEQMRLAAAADLHAAFFDLWTAKEALLKAWAMGLGDMPGDFTTPDAHFYTDRDTNSATRRFTLTRFAALPGLAPAAAFSMGRLAVPAGYRGAVCVREPANRVLHAPPSSFTFTSRTPIELLCAADALQSVC